MNKIALFFIIIAIAASFMSMTVSRVYASDYQGNENRGSVFQVLGDLITGKYDIEGKPIKEKGVFQVFADETKKMNLASDEPAGNKKSNKP